MRGEPTCPRCDGPLRPPGVWSNGWQCSLHGVVYPLYPAGHVSPELLFDTAHHAEVPVWLPWPLPSAWLFTGIRHAGDERTGARATAVACSGPNPVGGGADLVLVAEEPGVGLGARFAGASWPDPGTGLGDGPPQAKVLAAGHPTPLWWVASSGAGRAAYVGEARGQWLWAILFPESAALLLLEQLVLVDVRDVDRDLPLPCGALSPRLAG